MAEPVEAPEDLYGVDLADFVRERKALAGRLKAAGDTEAASAVRAMRKPPRSVAALNTLARGEGQARVDQVLAAARAVADALGAGGDQLRTAQSAYAKAVTVTVDAAADRAGITGEALERVPLRPCWRPRARSPTATSPPVCGPAPWPRTRPRRVPRSPAWSPAPNGLPTWSARRSPPTTPTLRQQQAAAAAAAAAEAAARRLARRRKAMEQEIERIAERAARLADAADAAEAAAVKRRVPRRTVRGRAPRRTAAPAGAGPARRVIG